MDKSNRITRRAALIGAAVSSAALALPVAAVVATEAEAADEAVTIEQLAEAFRDAAMKLDPRITECWIGYDETDHGPRDMRVASIYFGRNKTPYVPHPRPGSITDLFGQWGDVRDDRAGETDEQADARYAQYVELQRKITSMRPRTAREAAMQIVVETDDGDSDYREDFYSRLRLIAFGEV